MKFNRLLTIPLLTLLMTGCLMDDRDDCITDDNVELRFEYTTSGSAKFTDVITSVDAILFDADGYYSQHGRLEKGELEGFQGMRLTVDPGLYYVVAWANVRGNSVYNDFVPGVTPLAECLLTIAEQSTATGDPLYYAPAKAKPSDTRAATRSDYAIYEINVPYGESVVKRMEFVRAHRTINVWISRFKDSGNPSLQPTVSAGDLWTQYNFLFATQAPRRAFTQAASERTVEDAVYSLATFHSALGAIGDDMQVAVARTSDGAVRHTVNLKQFVADNNITDTDEIDIMITFLDDLGVSVTLPEWKDKNVTPGHEW